MMGPGRKPALEAGPTGELDFENGSILSSGAGMEALVGREVHVPLSVFAADVRRGETDPPANGEYWEGEILDYQGGSRNCFTVALSVTTGVLYDAQLRPH